MKFKQLLTGIIIGIGVSTVAVGFYLWNGNLKTQLSAEQIWAGQHPKETQYAKARFEKFQKAAQDAFFQDEVSK